MSYNSLSNEVPPAYGESSSQRVEGDNVPDDFKYSVDVASCELPVRLLFIRKVYTLLSMQLLGTLVVGYIMRYNTGIRDWCVSNSWLFFVAMVCSIGFLIATQMKARSYPTNVILLGCFTLCEAYVLGLACAFVKSEILVKALLLTFVIFIGLTLFSFQVRYDFTSWEGALAMGTWLLIGWGFIFMFFPSHSSLMENAYSCLGSLIFSIYIIVDTQKVMKTVHLDDEIPATITLYLDIVNLFLFILRLLSSRDND